MPNAKCNGKIPEYKNIRMKIAVTGGIACGKSRFAEALRRLGCETLDADDIVHTLMSDEERRRLAKIAFTDPAVRKALEARLHPIVDARFAEWFATGGEGAAPLKIAIIPLLFEVHWEKKYDIICAVICSKEKQIERMMQRRGLTRQEAEARLAAQLPVEHKAEHSHYVIRNDGSTEELENEAARFVSWLNKEKTQDE